MTLKQVKIFSSCTNKQAEEVINKAIQECDKDDSLAVNFELLIENSVAIAGNFDTRYTVVIHFYDLSEFEELFMEEKDEEY